MLFFVINESKGADTTGFESQIAHHALGTGEGEFAWCFLSGRHERRFQSLFQIVDSQVMVAVKSDKVMLGTLVVAHEDILAMHAAILAPPAFGFFDSLAFGVVVALKGYLICCQIS